MNNYDWLVARLDAFIRKYYTNKVIRGSLVFLSCLLCFVLAVSVSEYFLYMPSWLRVAIVTLFVSLGLSSLIAWVIIPLMKVARLGTLISHEQAASIIGEHFPEVSDKLLNILQLKNGLDNTGSRELAEASISQKIGQLSVVPIASAIDLTRNRRYMRYLAPPLAILLFIVVAAPNVFRESANRLLQPTKTFERPAPFRFVIDNKELVAVRNADFNLSVHMEGATLPADAAIDIDGERVSMVQPKAHTFQHTFRNVTDAISFRVYAGGFYSQTYKLRVIQRPLLKAFSVALRYPAYTGRKNETRNSLGDITVPAGTELSWTLATAHTDAVAIKFGTGAYVSLGSSGPSTFNYAFRFLNDTDYTLRLVNRQDNVADSFTYHVQVIPDQFPVIQMEQYKDSLSAKQVLLSGTAGDDYGISRITFNYQVASNGKTILSKSLQVKTNAGSALAPFEQYFDMQALNLKPGEKVTYYIEAWDNDGVHGSKSSRSEMMSFQMFDADQLDSAINENAEQINKGLSSGAEKTHKLQSDYKSTQDKLLQSTDMDWQMEQSLQQMMEKQQELQKQVEQVKERFDEQRQQSEQKEYSDDLREKQQELDKQLNNLLNEELKKQMEKLQELMQKLNKEATVDAMKQLEQENKLFSMDMERMQELMKRMELQMRLEDLANKMDAMAKEQQDLKAATEAGKKDDATLAKDQKALEDKLQKALDEDMKQAQDLAKETKQKDRLENEEQQGKEAQQQMEQSSEDIKSGQKSKAGSKQDQASKNLANMAKSMRDKAAGMDMEQIELDIKATRQLLSNLIRLSFAQEDLMDRLKVTLASSPAYLEIQTDQNKLHRNSQMIRDSLFVLSKRITKLAPSINKSTMELEHRMQLAKDNIEQRRRDLAVADQQYVMTYTNNLALLLNELLSNLMQMQSQGKGGGGSGMCRKPGGNKSGGGGMQLSDIISEQQKLGEGMQQMSRPGGKKPGGQQGEQPGKGKQGKGQGEGQGQSRGTGGGGNGEGNEGDNGEYGDAETLARMARQQAAIRRKLQQLSSELSSKGLGAFTKELRELEQKMDKNETDLVNRRTGADLVMRQKEITTRLLETEKAIREQEQDDKRSSKSAGEISRPVPPALQKYITDKRSMLEQYKTVPPQLKPYYRDMVEQYFQIIGSK